MPRRGREWSAVDRAMVALVRLVLDDDWDQNTAAARLREVVGDKRMLRRMAARVEWALADRDSEVAERAALTLRRALRDQGRVGVTEGGGRSSGSMRWASPTG